MALYTLGNVQQTYAGRTVLDIGQMAVTAGEVLALVGPSGAGKSTLLRVLNFLEAPSAGSICYDGQPIPYPAPLEVRRQITTVFQRPVLQRASVWDNIAYGLQLRGIRPGSQIENWIERIGLSAFAHQPARQLSGGELQRVALARALVVQPRVLLLDEPTANLDPYNVSLMEEIIHLENVERKTTIILVTHNLFQARRLAQRVGLLLAGQLIELSDTHAFFKAPQDARTAAFVRGDMVC